MKIEIEVKKVNSDYTWKETYDIESNIEPKIYAEQLISNFNATLRPNESPRELINVAIIEKNSEVIKEELFVDESNRLLSKFGY